jgi:hypothetical protein
VPSSVSRVRGEVARLVGYSEKWTREIARRYESEGAEGLGGNRSQNEYGPDVKTFKRTICT